MHYKPLFLTESKTTDWNWQRLFYSLGFHLANMWFGNFEKISWLSKYSYHVRCNRIPCMNCWLPLHREYFVQYKWNVSLLKPNCIGSAMHLEDTMEDKSRLPGLILFKKSARGLNYFSCLMVRVRVPRLNRFELDVWVAPRTSMESLPSREITKWIEGEHFNPI